MDLRPRDELFPVKQTREEAQQESTQEMNNSQEDATAAALSELGVPVPTVLTITGTVKGSGAEGKLNAGDILVGLDDQVINDLSVLRTELKKRTPGDVVKVKVKRGAEESVIDLTTSKGAQGQTVMGILLKAKYDFPVQAHISVADIGGPSAGMIFGLAIYDFMTPGDLTGGKHIAGTGTLASDGVVGPIGGAPQKIHAAKQAGAGWFLVPTQNCADIAGRVPEGIRPVRIDDFHAARLALESIAKGDEGALPSCPTN